MKDYERFRTTSQRKTSRRPTESKKLPLLFSTAGGCEIIGDQVSCTCEGENCNTRQVVLLAVNKASGVSDSWTWWKISLVVLAVSVVLVLLVIVAVTIHRRRQHIKAPKALETPKTATATATATTAPIDPKKTPVTAPSTPTTPAPQKDKEPSTATAAELEVPAAGVDDFYRFSETTRRLPDNLTHNASSGVAVRRGGEYAVMMSLSSSSGLRPDRTQSFHEG